VGFPAPTRMPTSHASASRNPGRDHGRTHGPCSYSTAAMLSVLAAILAFVCVFIGLPSPVKPDPLSSTAAQVASTSSFNCASPPLNNCSFYAECLETRYHCGPQGYPIGYGQKFCTKFQAQATRFTPAGQTWMVNTMHCLQEALVPEATGSANSSTDCSALEDRAFSTHAPCYIKNGLCTLPPIDWDEIIDVVGVQTLFNSWDALKASLAAGVDCLEFYGHLVARLL
ncbi:unnamed protein product, partial [Mycena citricolor]